MAQQLGETVQEMMQDDDKEVQRILNERPKGHYWIVIHHKPTPKRLDTGEFVIAKVIKPYNSKPPSLLGTVVLEVKDGEVVGHEINIHDMPIDWSRVMKFAGQEETPYVQKRKGLSRAYVYEGK